MVHPSHRLTVTVLREIGHLSQISTWRFCLSATADWLCIAASIYVSHLSDSWLVYAASVLVIAARQHALMILSHEGAHWRAHKKVWLNDFLSQVFCSYPIFFDTHIYRLTHFEHHQHLNTDHDPDWVKKIQLKEWQFPKSLAQLLVFWSRYFLGRGTLEWIRAVKYFSGVSFGWKFWAPKLLFWTAACLTIQNLELWPQFFAYWVVPFFMLFPAIQRLRSIAEHFGVPNHHHWNATRDIKASWAESFFLAPHNVHYHLCHHLFPSVPAHNLPKLHQILMSQENFRELSHQSGSYIMPSKSSLWKELQQKPTEVLKKSA